MSLQFFLGRPGFVWYPLGVACQGILESFIHNTCPGFLWYPSGVAYQGILESYIHNTCPGFLWYHSGVACQGILESFIHNTCPGHFTVLSLMMNSNFYNPVFFLISSVLTLSFHMSVMLSVCCHLVHWWLLSSLYSSLWSRPFNALHGYRLRPGFFHRRLN